MKRDIELKFGVHIVKSFTYTKKIVTFYYCSYGRILSFSREICENKKKVTHLPVGPFAGEMNTKASYDGRFVL